MALASMPGNCYLRDMRDEYTRISRSVGGSRAVAPALHGPIVIVRPL